MTERRIDGLAAARLWATDRFPYLATGLFGTEVVAADPTPDRWTAGWRVLGLAADAAPDVAAVAARVLARCRPDGAELPEEVRMFAPVLRAAGLLQG